MIYQIETVDWPQTVVLMTLMDDDKVIVRSLTDAYDCFLDLV